MGGTANLAVLGGNGRPSLAWQWDTVSRETAPRSACGLVAHRDGQVARSTLKPTALIRLGHDPVFRSAASSAPLGSLRREPTIQEIAAIEDLFRQIDRHVVILI